MWTDVWRQLWDSDGLPLRFTSCGCSVWVELLREAQTSYSGCVLACYCSLVLLSFLHCSASGSQTGVWKGRRECPEEGTGTWVGGSKQEGWLKIQRGSVVAMACVGVSGGKGLCTNEVTCGIHVELLGATAGDWWRD